MNESKESRSLRMEVGGMTCPDCDRHVVRALEGAGAQAVRADFRRGEARFRAAAEVALEALAEAVRRVGYKPGEIEALAADEDAAASGLEGARRMPARPPGDGRASGQGAYDLAIIGSGAAGFAAAIQATNHGARVVMVERGILGGTCVNIGCVPSKTLLRASEVHFQAREHPFAGLTTGAGPVDLGLLVGQKDGLVEKLRAEKYAALIEAYGFDYVRGSAEFLDDRRVRVGEQTIEARAFLVATGASPAVPDIPGLADAGFLTSTSALAQRRVPESLAIIGAGYIALELGQLFRRLGAQVTLMQRGERLLPAYDPEIATAVHGVLRDQGVEVLTGVRYDRAEACSGGRRVWIEVDGRRRAVEAQAVLVAVGRRPNTGELALERAGVELGPRGEVLVDDRLRTSTPGIYAAGDVTLGPQFVYVAAQEGALAADNALGTAERRVDHRIVPSVIFTHPAIAAVGLGEERAAEAGYRVRTSVLPLDAVPRALVNHDTAGVIKLVADADSGRLLGAQVVSENAGEVIYAATLAVRFGLTVQDLRETLAPYLTMAEGLKLAALAFDTDVSKLSCCAG